MNFFPVGPLVRRSGVFFIRRTFKDNPVYKFVLQQLHRLPDREAVLPRMVHRGRPLALRQAAAAALRARSPTSSTPTGAARARTCILIPVVDRLRSDPGRRRIRRPSSAGGKEARELRLVPRHGARRLRHRYGDIHIRFGEPALAGPVARPTGSPRAEHLERRPGRAASHGAEARLRGRRPHQPGHPDHADLAGGARARSAAATARFSVPEILVKALQNLVAVHPPTRPADDRRRSGSTRPRACSARSTRWSRAASSRRSPRVPRRSTPSARTSISPQRTTATRSSTSSSPPPSPRSRCCAPARYHVDSGGRRSGSEAMRLRDLLKFEFFFAEKERFRRSWPRRSRCTIRHVGVGSARGPAAIQGVVRSFRPVQRTSRAATVPRRPIGRRRRAGARDPDAPSTRTPSSRPLPRPRQAVPPPAPHPERRVGLEGALRDRRSGWPATATCSSAARPI